MKTNPRFQGLWAVLGCAVGMVHGACAPGLRCEDTATCPPSDGGNSDASGNTVPDTDASTGVSPDVLSDAGATSLETDAPTTASADAGDERTVQAWDAMRDVWTSETGPMMPVVVSSNPLANASNVERTEALRVTFSEAMETASLKEGGLKLLLGSAPVEGTVDIAGMTASFSPSYPLVLRATYTLVVGTTARSVAGSAMAKEWAASFTVRDGHWSSAMPVEKTPSGRVRAPQVGMDAKGNAVATWCSSADGVTGTASAAYYSSGVSWSNPTSGSLPLDAVRCDSRQLLVAANGRAFYSWDGASTAKTYIWPFDGKAWLTLKEIGANLSSVRMALDVFGRGLVVFGRPVSDAGSSFELAAVAFSPEFGWDKQPSRIASSLSEPSPKVVLNSRGAGLVGFLDKGTSSDVYDLWISDYSTNGPVRFTPAARVPYATELFKFDLAIGEDGSVAAIGTQKAQHARVIGSERSVTGAWKPASSLSDPSGPSHLSFLTGGSGGSVIATWIEIGAQRFRASRHITGAGWTPAETIPGFIPGGRAANPVALAFLDRGGSGFAFWTIPTNDDTPKPVAHSRYLDGVWQLSDEVTESSKIGMTAAYAVSPSGSAMILWTACSSVDAAKCDLWYRSFE